VLLLHGTGGNRETWTPLLATLDEQAESWSILMPDLPGHGQTHCTAHAQHGLREMAQDLQSLLLFLGIHRVDLVVGHSAGAAVAIWLALLSQERTVQSGFPSDASNGDPSGPTGASLGHAGLAPQLSIGRIIGVAPSLVPPPSLYNLLLGPLLNPVFVSGLSVSAIALLARNTGMVDRLIQSTGSKIPESQREVYRRLFREEEHVRGAIAFMAGTDLPTLLRKGKTLDTPLDLLIAEDDPWIPARALRGIAAEYFPSAQLHFCQGGHLVHEATPSILASLMHKALE
jgi:magnesium chelatase accessory protein